MVRMVGRVEWGVYRGTAIVDDLRTRHVFHAESYSQMAAGDRSSLSPFKQCV
jgi:hypothetical protein